MRELQWYVDKAAEYGLPDHMHFGVAEYIVNRKPTGGFLEAVISNNLTHAVGRADGLNREKLADWVMYFYNVAPSGCWGSPEAYRIWLGWE